MKIFYLVPLLLALAACADDDVTVATPPGPAMSSAPGAAGSQLADVVVVLDGERQGLQGSCQGADDAVVATTTSGRRVILVREQGPALRLSGEGDTFTETDDVTQEQIGLSLVYEGSVPVDGQPTPVRFEVREDVQLEPCEAVQ